MPDTPYVSRFPCTPPRWTAILLGTAAVCATVGIPAAAAAQTLAPTGMDHPIISGATAQRVAAMVAGNRALSPENAPPTVFHSPVSLDDPDVVAKARALSDQAGHNGLHYDYFRFSSALEKVRQIKADKLDIPMATYRIYPPARFNNGTGLINLSRLSHIVVDGHGATILFASIGLPEAPLDKTFPRAGIQIGGSDHLVLRDLVLDWYEPLVVPVRINMPGQPGAPMTLTVDRAFPIDPALPLPIRGLLPYNVPQRKILFSRDLSGPDYDNWLNEQGRNGTMPYLCGAPVSGVPASTCFRFVGAQTYQFGASEHLSPFPTRAGNFLASTRDNNFGAIIVDGNTSYLTVSGVTIYSSPGQGLVIINTGKAIHVSRVRIVRKPDALLLPGEPRRFISTLADGMDVINAMGDVVIENCEIADEADDGLNIRAALLRASVAGPHAFVAKAGSVANFYRIGGLVDIYDDKGNNLIAKSIPIAAVQAPAPGTPNFTVTLASSSPVLQSGSAYQIRVRDYDNDQVVVRNTWFHDNTERGVVVHNDNVAIINDRFDHTAESAIQVLYDNQSGRAEGAAASNVVIAGNVINDVNVSWFDSASRSVAAPGAIAVYFGSRSGFSDIADDHSGNVMARHLMISDNIIRNVPGAAILVSQADDVVVARNLMQNTGQHTFGVPAIDGNAMVIARTTHLSAADNTASAPIMLPPQ